MEWKWMMVLTQSLFIAFNIAMFYKGKSKMSLEPISSIPVEEAVAKEASLAPLAGRLAGVKFEPVSASGDSHVFTTEVADHCERSLGVKFHMGTKERERQAYS